MYLQTGKEGRAGAYTASDGDNLVSQATQKTGEERIELHAVAAMPAVHHFFKHFVQVDGDAPVLRIVQRGAGERDALDVQALQAAEVSEIVAFGAGFFGHPYML